MSFMSRLTGAMTLEVTSADPEGLLRLVTASDIDIFDIHRDSDLTVTFMSSANAYPILAGLCEKQGAKLKILRHTGIYWSWKNSTRRYLLLLGLAFLFGFCLFFPTRILFVQVQGNHSIPTRRILYAAQESGIVFGASRREVRSEKVKNALLSCLPELEWVGVNTAGCVAEISVRERTESKQPNTPHTVSHITAARDGYLLSMTVTSGNALCSPGQQVQKGQVLVSGYTDCGIYILATRSEAEIMAQTNRQLEVVSPSNALLRSRQTARKRKYSLLIGKKRINLWKGSGILDSRCGRIYKEKYATLPGGFQLPLALCVEEFIFYETTPAAISAAQVQNTLSSFAEQYLGRQMTAGTILSKNEQLQSEDGVIRLAGEYICQEMIGRVKLEQIGDEHG